MTLLDSLVAAPEMTLLGLLCVVLVADLFIDDENRALTFWFSMLALAGTLAALYWNMPAVRTVIFSGSYVSDSLSQILKISAVLFVAITFLYSRDYLRANDLKKGEFYLLGLFGLLGMTFLFIIGQSIWLSRHIQSDESK